MITIADINAMDSDLFVATFGDVAEHSPWVAKAAAALRPFVGRESLVRGFATVLLSADAKTQLALLREHPDLASKAKLTADSQSEQKGAGLDRLTTEEFAHFTHLNEVYKKQFGFPFIYAVRGAGKRQIIESFEGRIGNSREAELEMAIKHVTQIFRFRLEDRVLL